MKSTTNSILKFLIWLNIPTVNHPIEPASKEIATGIYILFCPSSSTYHTAVTLKIINTISCYRSQQSFNASHTVRLLRGRRASRCPLRSKRSTLRLSRGTAMTLDGETDTLFTGLSQRIEANGERMFRKSHTLAVRSSDPETTLSSRVNVTHVTTMQPIGK